MLPQRSYVDRMTELTPKSFEKFMRKGENLSSFSLKDQRYVIDYLFKKMGNLFGKSKCPWMSENYGIVAEVWRMGLQRLHLKKILAGLYEVILAASNDKTDEAPSSVERFVEICLKADPKILLTEPVDNFVDNAEKLYEYRGLTVESKEIARSNLERIRQILDRVEIAN